MGRPHTSPVLLSLLTAFALAGSCGTNTNSPVYPISSILAVGMPAIIDLKPPDFALEPVAILNPPQFKVSFYVTNQEDDFIGYNLYITQSYVAPDSGLAGKPYLPAGIEPSFSYTKADASTLAANLKTQTVTAFKAPPSPVFFQFCRFYYFSMKAVLRNGTLSSASPQLSSCILDDLYCPTTAGCL